MLDHTSMVDVAAQVDVADITTPAPGSPPPMTSSKSSKTSSLRSFSDDDDTVAADISHFEEIGLEDDADAIDPYLREGHIKSHPNPYSPNYTADLRAASVKHVGANPLHKPRDLARLRLQRDVKPLSRTRTTPPSISTQIRDTNTHNLNVGLGISPAPQSSPLPVRGLSVRSVSASGSSRRRRSPSPGLPYHRSLSPAESIIAGKPRRTSSQSARETRSIAEIEKECDEDDDNIPDELILDNVPLSPRPPTERPASRPASAAASPERQVKEKTRSVGNGTPSIAKDQGCLKSPTWRSEHVMDASKPPPSPLNGRAKSWTAAISELNAEAKALTEKLEEHADELDKHHLSPERPVLKPRVKSAMAELPPLRRTNIMIDPLPISKEKEAVLSRTRPSWLPPKDPAEEKRHLREYQRMMANSIEVEKRREAARREQEKNKDRAANTTMKTWETGVLKRWDQAVKEPRTRELSWKGIAPRCRGQVWSRAIGNDLGLTETSFKAALARSYEVEKRASAGNSDAEDERRMSWFGEIRSDVEERTWVDLKIFQAGAPLHQSLIDVLRAYSMYRSDIGYVAGCHTIAAVLLLNLDTPAATFVALANLLNRPLPLSFFSSDPGAQATACQLVDQVLVAKSQRLGRHLHSRDLGLEASSYLGDMFTALFTRHLSLDECTRLWDVYVFEGDKVLIRAAVALLLEKEMTLLGAETAEDVMKALAERPTIEGPGKEEEWMTRVREAGKA
ncbi:TBC domain-containing protein [Xylariomycetidae sp. FL0641]|nr:TBC domain-containing protein [Xylariomycetidae sp. FL0641]